MKGYIEVDARSNVAGAKILVDALALVGSVPPFEQLAKALCAASEPLSTLWIDPVGGKFWMHNEDTTVGSLTTVSSSNCATLSVGGDGAWEASTTNGNYPEDAVAAVVGSVGDVSQVLAILFRMNNEDWVMCWSQEEGTINLYTVDRAAFVADANTKYGAVTVGPSLVGAIGDVTVSRDPVSLTPET